jgi:hypothetical protein
MQMDSYRNGWEKRNESEDVTKYILFNRVLISKSHEYLKE